MLERPGCRLVKLCRCDHGQAHQRAELFVRNLVARGLADARHALRDAIDLVGRNVHATTDDHLRGSSLDVEEAVLAALQQVTGVHPAVNQHLCGAFGIVPVAQHVGR
ncbi:Uncharacterised protein [Mycobacterium tuberculosis]|nr:Uncharacterised protein [Mycobacterium tuberculosis]